jgi:hypothetical protein
MFSPFPILSFTRKRLLITVALLSALGPLKAKADLFTSCGIDLGEFRAAGFVDGNGRRVHWGAFVVGGSFNSGERNEFANSDVYGDVGVAGGSVKMHSGTIHGRLYAATNVDVDIKRPGRVTEGVEQGTPNANTILNQGVMDANRISMQAAGMAATDFSLTTVNFKNRNYTYNLTLTCNVLNLTDFSLKGGTFTLVGTAAQGIILNVSRDFSLTNGAHIVLSGGLTWDSVLFNIIGTGHVALLDEASTMQGMLLATRRTVRMRNHSTVDGEVISRDIDIGGMSRIRNPVVSQ